MTYFYLFPLYWLCGVLMYAASPRQQLSQSNQALLTKWPGIVSLTALSLLNIHLVVSAGASIGTAVIGVVLALMLFVPMPVFLINHKPKWLVPTSFLVFMLSFLSQLLMESR